MSSLGGDMKAYDVEKLPDLELRFYLQDWHHAMVHAHGGGSPPPKLSKLMGSMNLKGIHLCFTEFVRYCKSRGLEIEGY